MAVASVPSITFTGLGSGIDSASIIDAMVKAEKAHTVDIYENWKSQWQEKLDALNTLDQKLSSLRSQAASMDTMAEMLVRTATSSDDDIVSVQAQSEALLGSHTVTVGSSINHRLAAQGWPDTNTTGVGDSGGDFIVYVGGTQSVDVPDSEITSSTTLSQLRDLINSYSDGRVTAEIIDDGTSSNNYRLVLTATTGGTSNIVTVTSNPTNLDFSNTNIDNVEYVSWSGSATVTSSGTYTGSTNKTFYFTVSEGGTLGTDTIVIEWTDSEGNTGSFDITPSEVGVAQDIGELSGHGQGVQITLSSSGNTVSEGDTFNVDVFHPNLQKAQDDGLAKAEMEVHSGFSDEDTTAVTNTDATFSYTYAGTTRTINVPAGTTLSELVDLINNDPGNLGVKASIMNDGSGLSTAYHLVLTGENTGAAYTISNISHTLDNFATGGATGGGFSETQAAQNAMIRVDGYPTDPKVYIQKSSNTVSDVISGLTLSLKSTGTVTITVGTDTDAMKEKITNFVKAINDVKTYIKEVTKYDTNTKTAGPLIGNYAVEILQNILDKVIIEPAPGFVDGEETYTLLSQIGITTDAQTGSATEGQLVIDEEKLDQALSENPDAVAKLFAADFEYKTDDTHFSFVAKGFDTKPGVYNVEVDLTGSGSTDEMGRFDYGADGTWSPWVSLSGSSGDYVLVGEDGYPEEDLAIGISYTSGSGVHTTRIKLLQGFAGYLRKNLEILTDPYDGILKNVEDNYSDVIEDINKKIEREEERLSLYEKRLRDRFARLEEILAELQRQSQTLSQKLGQVGG